MSIIILGCLWLSFRCHSSIFCALVFTFAARAPLWATLGLMHGVVCSLVWSPSCCGSWLEVLVVRRSAWVWLMFELLLCFYVCVFVLLEQYPAFWIGIGLRNMSQFGGDGHQTVFCRVAFVREKLARPWAARSITDSKFSLICSLCTAGTVSFLFFCELLMQPVCVILERFAVSVFVNVNASVLRCMDAWV